MFPLPTTKDYTGLEEVDSGRFQFGFESEFADSTTCFKYYGINSKSLGEIEGPAALDAYCRTLAHGDKRVVLEKRGGPAFLPPTLHRDDTGNVELVIGPYADHRAFARDCRWVNENIGLGSLQAMVSLSREDFFANDPEGLKALGWLNFFNELDILERLERGRERMASSPDSPPLRSFLHPYLGPMVALRHRLLKKFLRENAKGEMLDAESLIRPARRDHSFKFVGSTAYRPDIAGPARMCLEVRDAHRDETLLNNRVARILFYWSRPREIFLPFAAFPPFDSAEIFNGIDPKIQAWLISVAPGRGPAAAQGFEKARFSYEVYRNFGYALRDWSPWVEALGGEISPVIKTQSVYLSRLVAGAEAGEGIISAQRALCDFSRGSGLFTLFRLAEERLAGECS